MDTRIGQPKGPGNPIGIETEIQIDGGPKTKDPGLPGAGEQLPDPEVAGRAGGNDPLAEELLKQLKNLGGGGETTVEDLRPGATAMGEKEFLKALNSIAGSTDELAALLIKFANMSRQDALDQRLQSRAAARGDLEAQADETREAALKNLIGAVVSAAIAVVSAFISIKGATSSVKNSAQAYDATKQSTAMNKTADDMKIDAAQTKKIATNAETSGSSAAPTLKADAKTSKLEADKVGQDATAKQAEAGEKQVKAQAEGTRAQALTQALGAISQVAGKALEYSAALDQAEGQEKAAKAQDEQANSDIAKKFMDDIEEMVKSTMRFLKEMQTAETDLMANMTRV